MHQKIKTKTHGTSWESMNYRKLPKTSLQISEIGFGCMSLDLSQEDNTQLLAEAIDMGINYFDTADLYDHGANEALVGKALKAHRKDLIIATKVGNEWLPDGKSWRWNPSKAHILQAVDKSLERLQTDYIDLYQLHGGTIDDPIDEVIEAFESLQQAGKIRHYGISSIRPNVIRRFVERSKIVSDMLQYSLLDRRPEEEVLDHLQDHDVGVMVRGALAKGLLAGKPAKEYLDISSSEVEQLQRVLQELADNERTMGQLAIEYVLSNPAVTTAVIGIRTVSQLHEAGKINGSAKLSDSERHLLAKCLPAHQYTQHR